MEAPESGLRLVNFFTVECSGKCSRLVTQIIFGYARIVAHAPRTEAKSLKDNFPSFETEYAVGNLDECSDNQRG